MKFFTYKTGVKLWIHVPLAVYPRYAGFVEKVVVKIA